MGDEEPLDAVDISTSTTNKIDIRLPDLPEIWMGETASSTDNNEDKLGPFNLLWTAEGKSTDSSAAVTTALLWDERTNGWLRLEVETDAGDAAAYQNFRLMRADQILAKLTQSKAYELTDLGYSWNRLSPTLDYYVIRVPEFTEIGKYDRAIKHLSKVTQEALIEPDLIYWVTRTPDDPGFGTDQWAYQELGEGSIGLPQAWNVATGTEGVKIAILDTGIDIDHEDLKPNLWRNDREISGNGIDDDQNGLVDDLHGYSFVRSSAEIDDLNGHGTHVAGIAAASGNNGVGVTGVAWEADLVGIQVLNDEGYGPTSAIVQGIDYANTIGAKILNMSFGSFSKSSILEEAIESIGDFDGLAVASAGNDFQNIDASPYYPASLTSDFLISVSASDRLGRQSSFSNSGFESVDLAAPGSEIYSTYLVEEGGYKAMSGTSMAAPMVSGTLALLQADTPSLTALERRDRILNGLTRFQHLEKRNSGSGLLNVNNAIRNLKTGPYYDSFDKGIRLFPSRTSISLNNIESTREEFEPNHNGSTSETTVWAILVYDEPTAAEIAVSSVEIDLDFEVYTGNTISGLKSVAKGASGIPARFTARRGAIYRIAISGRENSSGQFELRLSQRPANDDLAGASPIEGDEFTISTSLVGATVEQGEPIHAGLLSDQTLWWSFRPSESALVKIDTEGSDFDTSLAVYTGDEIKALTLISSNDNANTDTKSSSLSFQGLAGTTYFIAAGNKTGESGQLKLKGGLLKPMVIERHPSDVRQQVGGTAIFSVTANQSVFTSYQWYFDGRTLPNQNSARLILTDINTDYVGAYKVVVSNGITSQTSEAGMLDLAFTGKGVALNPSSVTVPYGGNTFLYGGIESDSPVEYQWFKNGSPITEAVDSILKITDASDSDSGFYYLKANGSFGTLFTNQALIIAEEQNRHEERTFWPDFDDSGNLQVKELERQFFMLGSVNALYQSADGKTWIKLEPGIQGRIKEISFDSERGRFYVFSDVFIGAWTTDFRTWTTFNLPTNFELRKVFYGNSVFVAEAQEPNDFTERLIAVSGNAIDWSTHKGSAYPRDIAYGNGVFVGGNGFEAFRSVDGKNWEKGDQFYSNERALFSGNEFLLADLASIRESPVVSADGIDWQPTFPRGFHRDIYASGGVWLFHRGDFPSYSYSDNSLEIVPVNAPPELSTDQYFSMAHSNGVIVLVSEKGLIHSGKLGDPLPEDLSSYSGPGDVDSISEPIIDIRLGQEIKFANPLSPFDLKERIVDPFGKLEKVEVWANGRKEAEALSPNFNLEWRPRSFGTIDIEIRAATEGVSYVAAEEKVVSLVPTPQSINPKFDDITAVTRFKEHVYRISSQGSLQKSKNGHEWRSVPFPQYGIFSRILANEESIVALNSDLEVIQSNDGTTWNVVSVGGGLNYSFSMFELIDETFYLYVNAGESSRKSGVIFYSKSGLDWRSVTPFEDMLIQDLVINNGLLLGKFVTNEDEFGPAVIGTGNLQVGSNWTVGDSIDGSGIVDIGAFNGFFAAATSDNNIYFSPNGVDWTLSVIIPEGEIVSLSNSEDRITVASITQNTPFEKITHLYETNDYKTWSESTLDEFGAFKMIDSATNGPVSVGLWTENLWSFPVRGHLRISLNKGPWHDTGLSGEYSAIEWTGDFFIAVGPSGASATSADGLSWIEESGLYWDQTKVEGHAWFKGRLFVSIDNWLHRFDKEQGLVNLEIPSAGSVAATDTHLAIESWGDSRLEISTDGEIFSKIDLDPPVSIGELFATSTHLMSIDSGRNAFASKDGVDWQVIDFGYEPPPADFVHILNNGQAIIDVDPSFFLLSSNFTNWEKVQRPFNDHISGLAYTQNEYRFYLDTHIDTRRVRTTSDFSTWSEFTYTQSRPFVKIGELPSHFAGIEGSESGTFINGEFIYHHATPDKVNAFAVLNRRLGATHLSVDDNILTLKSDKGYLGIIPLGDLAIAKIDVLDGSTARRVGDRFSGAVEIANWGLETVRISEGTVLEIFAQSDPSERGKPIHLSRLNIEPLSLSPGSSIQVPFDLQVPNGIDAGAWYLGGHVDVGDVSFEMNEHNNRYLHPTPIGIIDEVNLKIVVTGNGYVESFINLDNVAKNSLVELFPVPEIQNRFVGWGGDYDGVLTPASFSATEDRLIEATFARVHRLEIDVLGGGIVKSNPEGLSILSGETIELEAIPLPGWRFHEWSGDFISDNPEERITVSDDHSVRATFTFHYDDWLTHYFEPIELEDPSISGPHADPDKDGLPNLMEATLLRSPRFPEGNVPFTVSFDGEVFQFSFYEMRGWDEISWNAQSLKASSNWTDVSFEYSSEVHDPQSLRSSIKIEADLDNPTVYRLILNRE